MSERRVSKNQIYELSPKVVGELKERVPRQLRKGVPEEYRVLLEQSRQETHEKVEEVIRKSAKKRVPELYAILTKDAGYTPYNARITIVADCIDIWGKKYTETYLPAETKDQRKVKGAKVMVENRRQKVETVKNKIKTELEPIIPDPTEQEIDAVRKNPRLVGLAAADQATRERVAKAGGEAKLEQHPESFSEMGKDSADKWARLRQESKTLQLEIEDEEHRLLVEAYQQSLIKRQNGTGGYMIFIKNGEFERVEPSNGIPEKSVNK